MRKKSAINFLAIISIALLFFTFTNPLQAGSGDTTWVGPYNFTWTWNGNSYGWNEFPTDTLTFRKVIMHMNVSCASGGCSAFDYSADHYIRHYTGVMDSTLVLAPDFTVDGSTVDSICYNNDTTYATVYNVGTKLTDTLLATQQLIREFKDVGDPWLQSDSLLVWPGNYWNYLYDTLGVRTDSSWISSDTCWYISYDSTYNLFEVTEDYEMAGFITPFGNQFGSNWDFNWTYDITDFEPLLHDSVQIRSFYGGWASGWEIELMFEVIEGTPPRDVIEVTNLWNGNPLYGNISNPIENHWVPRTIPIDANAATAMVRINTTGHSFGSDPCAEFCKKIHELEVDGGSTYPIDFWRDDCDLNPLYPQGGTWLYDRGGWCPGSEVRPVFTDVSSHLSPGSNMILDLNAAPYTYTGGNGFHPSYRVGSQLFQYKSSNHALDAELYNVLAPTDADMQGRMNPICGHPEVVIRNSGSTTLTSVDISYGVQGGTMSTYTWTGSLDFMESESVELSTPDWGVLAASGNIFIATLSNPNGGTDEYAENDVITSVFDAPRHMPNEFYLLIRTNNQATQTKYQILDKAGNQVYASSPFWGPNSIYRDTFNLTGDCYTFRLYDLGGNGLSFFANNDGTGFARLHRVDNGSNILTFEPDFGGEQIINFTTDELVGISPESNQNSIRIYPNPSRGIVFANLQLEQLQDVEIMVYNLLGRAVFNETIEQVKTLEKQIDLSQQSSGIYLVSIRTQAGTTTRRIVIE